MKFCKSFKMVGLVVIFAVSLATVITPLIAQNVPQSISHDPNKGVTLVCTQQHHFSASRNPVNYSDAPVQWMVAGVAGGDGQVGTITARGLYTAPRTAPDSPVEIAAVDAKSGQLVYLATVTVVDDPAVAAAHESWLEGVKAAAEEHHCEGNLVEQLPSETVDDAIKLYIQVATENTCLVLQPVSADAHSHRYSFASGGEKDGVNILYISDVSRIRIWNGAEVSTD